MSTPQDAFSSIRSEELTSVAGGLATATALSDPKLRPLFHLTHEISQLGQQQQSQNQATQTMMMAAVMSRAMRQG